MSRAAADFAAIDLLKTFSGAFSENPIGRIVEIDLLEPRLTNRDLVKVPGCPVCAPARRDAAANEPRKAAAAPQAAEGTEPEPAEPDAEPAASTAAEGAA
jgi:hypothetical protein